MIEAGTQGEDTPESRSPAQPTMRDIAARAGVSPMSVSRALRGDRGVSESTRAQVLETIKALGYRPNEFARQLRTGGPTNVIALIVGHLANPFYAELAVGVERVAASHGTRLMIMSAQNDLATEQDVIADLRRRQVDGVIIVPATPDHRHLDQLGGPNTAVVFATTPPNGVEASSVIVDDFGGMRELCSRLLTAGHRRIGLLGLNRAMWTGSERLRGYAAAHAEASVPVDDRLITEHAGDIGWSMQETRRLLRLADPPTAVIAANNQMTIGALRAAKDEDSDVTVAGFDDIEVADLFWRPLTLVTYDADQLGARCAEVLFERRSALAGSGSERPAGGSLVRDVIPTKLICYGEPDGRN
ncbi:MAG: LacI family DNA-binding transcriptional regulator [Microlunatus sp.]|nr:LacI family DNA-binding transcriptional regulator [Microlunatus sp.]